ncbi:MAG: site-specific integrase [Tannerellaceae bacterium]|jgi:integrase|nr:site-specific integrase [Tannerellaceae bacterium]
MKKKMDHLIINQKEQLNVEGKMFIQVEAYLDEHGKDTLLKMYFEPNQWDSKKKFVKGHPEIDIENQNLKDFISKLGQLEFFITLKEGGFKLNIPKGKKKKKPVSFTSFMKDEIELSHLRPSTMKNHLSTLSLLSLFKENVTFKEINYKFLCDFENHLLTYRYHRNTIAKHMKHLKRYINLAINKELFTMEKYPFRKYKIKYTESLRNHLTPEELDKLENVNLGKNKNLQKCLDMFLFSCYTGLRFSDITTITKENFLYIDDKLWLVYSSVKTDINVRLPLSLLFEGKAISIFNRYKNTLFNTSVDSNSNINKQLQLICRKANIDKKISFHTARHTNATLLLYNGASITTVQKLLGHKSVRTTEIYSKIIDLTIIRDLEKIY